MLLVTALLAVTVAPRPFPEERLLLDRRLETLRRILPDGPNPVSDAAVVKELAESAKLSSIEALARPPVDASTPSAAVVVDLTAVAPYVQIERFIRLVALSPRLIDVESLVLSSTPERAIKATAVLHLPYRPAKAPLPPAPEGTRRRISGASRAQADAYLRDAALAVAKTETIAALRRNRRNPRLFLAELAAVVDDRPVVLNQASVGDDFVVRGLAVGEGPVRALQSRFERGFFRMSEFIMARQAACLRFEARGRSPVVGPDAELPLPTDDPFEQDDLPCRIDRDAVRTVVIKGASRPGQGPLSLRLRDVDLTDVFSILHGLTSQGFLVDGDVVGRVSVELNRTTLEEALASIAKAADLSLSGSGSVRRVSLAKNAPRETKKRSGRGKPAPSPSPSPSPSDAPSSSVSASFTIKRGEVRDILAAMTDLDPALASLGPPGFLGRVSLWVKDVPLVELRSSVLAAAGLTERVEEDRRVLVKADESGSEDDLVPVAGAASDRQLLLKAQDLTIDEFDLAGLASTGSGWVAYAYSPTGALHTYKPGETLWDGTFTDIQSTDVTLETDEGPVRLPLGRLP
jgi:hypothetical protein